MKKYMFCLITVCCVFSGSSLFASTDTTLSIANIDFQFSSQPNPKGNKSFGLLRYYYDEEKSLSSCFAFSYEKRTVDGSLMSRSESLLLTKTSDLILDCNLIEYTGDFFNGMLKLRPGLTFSMTNSKSDEKGYFITSAANPFHPSLPETATTNHIFSNEVNTWFYSPKLKLDALFSTEYFRFKYTGECVPIYYYRMNQTLLITPLVPSGKGTNSNKATTGPYVQNNISLIFFNYIEFLFSHEYQGLKYKQLGLDYNAGWTFKVGDENKYTITYMTLLVNLRLPVYSDSDLILGIGKRYIETKNDTTNESLVDENEVVLNFGFGKKF